MTPKDKNSMSTLGCLIAFDSGTVLAPRVTLHIVYKESLGPYEKDCMTLKFRRRKLGAYY